MNPLQWMPALVAIMTVVGNAYVTNSTVQRHERDLMSLREEVQELKTAVAVLKSQHERG